MLRVATAAGVLAATLACAGTAHAGQVLKVDDGKARIVRDRLLPPAATTALPPVPRGTRLLVPPVRARRAPARAAQRVHGRTDRRTAHARPAAPGPGA